MPLFCLYTVYTMSIQLARRWRSKNFDEIVGQELAVRLLKNSLYRQYFLPVYLFSGLRGSGKTSLARIFATAVNCGALDQFSANPKIIMPCGACESCQAAILGKHPDIIELDAASHTGVDNIRTILENASFLPNLGRKRIYIIDEAHMLSRAAFNACLKLFEEPPAHVLFILATTDPEKIIDTITSRSFQVFFDPLTTPQLVGRLEHICKAEGIAYDLAGLIMIAEHAQGSARDALTTLERLLLAVDGITQKNVQQTLGVLHPDDIQKLFILLATGATTDVMQWAHTHIAERVIPGGVWRSLVAMLQDALFTLHNVEVATLSQYSQAWKDAVSNCSPHQLTAWFSRAYEAEQIIFKSSASREALMCLLVQLSEHTQGTAPQAPTPVVRTETVPVAVKPVPSEQQEWQKIVKQIVDTTREPMAQALFGSSLLKAIDSAAKTCTVQFLKEHALFSDWIENLQKTIGAVLQEVYQQPLRMVPEFTLEKLDKSTAAPVKRAYTQPPAPAAVPHREKPRHSENINQALKLFPGTVSEL